uniref:Uncharacterized protein n=1 Tax=Romanomermis culicivorax TaxID=13658 RepID=A0A915IBJ2_ROMCU
MNGRKKRKRQTLKMQEKRKTMRNQNVKRNIQKIDKNSTGHSYGIKPFFHGTKDAVGYILGSLSAACYLAGRLPQLYKNMKRKSTEGVSLLMFLIIITANFLYGLSVLLSGNTFSYVLHHLPWLVGSFACCLLDCLVLYQYFLYRKERDENLLQSTADSDSILQDDNAAVKSLGEENLASNSGEGQFID